jgi:DNA replication protein DnaC
MTDHNQFPIPRRYLDQGAKEALANPRKCDARLLAFAGAWDGLSGAVLLGGTGCGKSLSAGQAGARVDALNSSDSWVKWIRADELSRLLADRSGHESVEQLKRARCLIIDELGYERFPELVLEVIGARHDWERPTLVTTGLRIEALAARYSDATVRRITETGNGCSVDCWDPIPQRRPKPVPAPGPGRLTT